MDKYILQMPKLFEVGRFYVISTDGYMYLRPSGKVLHSTGYMDGVDVGYWKTFEEALKAKQLYEGTYNPIWLHNKGIK